MNAAIWAVEVELINGLPLSEVTLEITQDQYRFHIFRPDERVTHVVTFNRLEFDACSLAQLLGLLMDYEVILTLELAPVALEITCRLAGMTVLPIYVDLPEPLDGAVRKE